MRKLRLLGAHGGKRESKQLLGHGGVVCVKWSPQGGLECSLSLAVLFFICCLMTFLGVNSYLNQSFKGQLTGSC